MLFRFTTVVALLLFIGPIDGEAQPAGKVYRVGLIFDTSPVSEMAGSDPIHPGAKAFVHGLRALGYVEGQNLILERRSTEGRFEQAADIINELVRLKIDVIVTAANRMTQQAKATTTTIPIVMIISTDPVGAGLVSSLAHPGGNITGLTMYVDPEIDAKRLELLKEIVPRASRVAYLGMKEDCDAPWGRRVRAAAEALGLTLVLAEHAPNDFADAFALLSRVRLDALFVSLYPPAFTHRRLIVDFATRNRLPSTHAYREAVELGGLMSYGVHATDLPRRAAGYVDKILKGAKPSDLPIEQPTKFELVINTRTAKLLGLTIPPSLLLRADQIIER